MPVAQSTTQDKQVKGHAQCSWEGISEPGAYVEVQTGRLFRVPQEALLAGSSPLIRQNSTQQPTYVQLSASPYISVFEARMLSAEQNVEPRF